MVISKKQYAWLISLFIVTGCGGKAVINVAPESMIKKQYSIENPEQLPSETTLYMDQVILGAGDVINIQSLRTPELNTLQQIRPDGKISIYYIGEVTAEGKTPDMLHHDLISLLSTELIDPELTITIESLFSSRIFVGGDVAAPGVIESPGRITVIESIVQAGGFNLETASLEDVVVIRRQNNGYYTGYQLDIHNAVKGLPHIPFYLEPFDVVYVPQKKIIGINLWMDHYIDGLIPQVLSGTFLIYLLTTYSSN